MSTKFSQTLPASLSVQLYSPEILLITLTRPEKRNALNDAMIEGMGTVFSTLPDTVRVVVLQGSGDDFSAGLDLSEAVGRDLMASVATSRTWHRVFEGIQFGKVPVIAVLTGAVIGGGLELACAAHLRVAEGSAYYALPEGQRGVYVGGGGSVRLPKLIGTARTMDMLLTGRTYDAPGGHKIGLSNYLVEPGRGLETALDLARKISANALITNFAVIQALPRIAQSESEAGYFTESLISAMAQSSAEAQQRIRDFLAKRIPKDGAS
jgi:enoyl-CoA hydratase/carnithine racemase